MIEAGDSEEGGDITSLPSPPAAEARAQIEANREPPPHLLWAVDGVPSGGSVAGEAVGDPLLAPRDRRQGHGGDAVRPGLRRLSPHPEAAAPLHAGASQAHLPGGPHRLSAALHPRRRLRLRAPGGHPLRAGNYVVAELLPAFDDHHATLLYYSTHTDSWDVVKDIAAPARMPQRMRPWAVQGSFSRDGLLPWVRVLSHNGKLWWFDPFYGIVTCDPFAQEVELRFIPLPSASNVDTQAVHRGVIPDR